MRNYRRQMQQAKEKAANREKLALEAQLPMEELVAGVRERDGGQRLARRSGLATTPEPLINS